MLAQNFRSICVSAALILTSLPFTAAASVAAEVSPVASSLVRPGAGEKKPSDQGFIQRWLVLEPIPSPALTQNAVQAAVKKEQFPSHLTVIPRDGDKVKVDGQGLTWHAWDTKEYNFNLFHFAAALGKPTSNVLFWVVTFVNCPEEVRDVRLAIGSNAASVWWLNGEEVIGLYNDRQATIDDGVSKRLTLKKGQNVIRAAIVNGGGATDFCARFLDRDEKPLKNFTITVVSAAP